jgi:methylthioribulose-1-phosphate dehydratase
MTVDPRSQLMDAATLFYGRGWMMGTAGNLSARVGQEHFWITASGCAKGKLTPDDFVQLHLDRETHAHTMLTEQPHPDRKPSAETSIHAVIYSLFPDAQACFHVHSIESNLVSNFGDDDAIQLPPLEMIKGLGIWDETPQVYLPLFPNHLNVPQIAQDIRDRFTYDPPKIPALLIRNHGITVWANTLQAAVNQVEVVEYLLRYLVAERQIKY